jgi:hypothetical protein
MMVSGQRNEFQLARKNRIASAERIGRLSGRMIAPIDTEIAGAVDHRRLFQFARHRQIELAQQEDAERVEDRGHDQAGVAVEEVRGSARE